MLRRKDSLPLLQERLGAHGVLMLSVSGRESLVDTAFRTSKSGYMQRRYQRDG
ncbi:MAG: hypothetical protein Ct9H90mP16_21410 [Candidatus Poseidoniales archaeon]|nr:MAG: hypothetical protein Ct9H90mP16_21410 [Candidatus Poseidoniales archaeon]